MRSFRYLFWLIIGLTILAIFIDFPSFNFKSISLDQNVLLQKLNIKKNLEFKEGLDLKGGTSLVLQADMKKIPSAQRSNALESAKTVIEARVNPQGALEPIIKTSIGNNDYRIIAQLPGITNLQQIINLIGTTAQLTFWEQASSSAKIATDAAGFVETDLSGADIKQTNVTFDTNTGKPQVQLQFTDKGAKKFADITRRNVGKPLAIALDNQLIEEPVVKQEIVGGNAVISGSFTLDQANQLSTQLNAGALPVPLKTLSANIIAPTLGTDSLVKSLFAGVLGFIIIVIFMCVLYRKLGIIASVALFLYMLFVLSIFKLSSLTPYPITLTLSGIAGFILSIGMAVDANILIFERTKEELRAGKLSQTAIELGFSRAWTSIRDSNVSTLITSFVLLEFGTGTVKGFALVLAIGVLVSMFSAVVITRTFLRFIYR